MKDGFIKIAAASPVIRVADPDYNADRVIACVRRAEARGVKLLAFPELTLTGCSCRDLFSHQLLLKGAREALLKVAEATRDTDMLLFVGLPVQLGSQLLSCAAVLYKGEPLALVPRTATRGSAFTPLAESFSPWRLGPLSVPVTDTCLFACAPLPQLRVAVELGGDLDEPLSLAAEHALSGATLLVQMASFPLTVTAVDEARLSLRTDSRRLKCGVLLAAPGKGESSTDHAWSGYCAAAEAGAILAQAEGEDTLIVTELDADYLDNLRRGDESFCRQEMGTILWNAGEADTKLTRAYSKHPHLPGEAEALPAYCRRLLEIQVSALVKRMQYARLDHCVVGISGGVDSTLAVLVSALAVRRLGLPPENVVACTMPCFGTSSRTKSNAIIVAEQIGAEVRVIDIGKAVYQHFDDIGHAHDDYSIAFENAQARERTQVLMDIANKVNGLDVGTEDLSEFIDGWCTYNGDHTSMYDVNMGLTKTQVRAAVRHIAQHTDNKTLAAALWDVLDCPVTPELLPIHDDQIQQKSEEAVGSYSLQDFFTHKILLCGFTPSKTFRLAKLAYGDSFSDEELLRWLKSYCTRLFSQQFKRSCLMDGPAVEAFSVSPRTGFRLPSDAENALFLSDLARLEARLKA